MYLHIVFAVFILFHSIDISLSDDPHWNYRELGPDVWKDFYPTCGSIAQSPINIKTECTIYQTYPPFQFSFPYYLTQDFLLTNNGHTVIGEQMNEIDFPLILSGGGLSEIFTFRNFHLHWGENYNSGSEHQVNGQKYSGEIHFVHTNAAGTQNAVLAIFMQSSPWKNSNNNESNESGRRRKRRTKRQTFSTDNSTFLEWEKYFAIADKLNNTDDSVVLNLNLATLMGADLDNFYRYSGSLTTPPCTQNVIWTVFQTPVTFTEFQLASFRSQLYSEDFRGPQPVYGRTVYRNFPNAILSSIPDYACCEEDREIEETTNGSNDGNTILLINRQLFTYFSVIFFSFNFLF